MNSPCRSSACWSESRFSFRAPSLLAFRRARSALPLASNSLPSQPKPAPLAFPASLPRPGPDRHSSSRCFCKSSRSASPDFSSADASRSPSPRPSSVNSAHYSVITFVLGGIIGALLLLALFDWALDHFLGHRRRAPDCGQRSFAEHRAHHPCRRARALRDHRAVSDVPAQPARALVPEMTDAGEDHRDLAFVGGGNDFLVADRAARLNRGGRARFGRRDQAIRERERRHRSPPRCP